MLEHKMPCPIVPQMNMKSFLSMDGDNRTLRIYARWMYEYVGYQARKSVKDDARLKHFLVPKEKLVGSMMWSRNAACGPRSACRNSVRRIAHQS